VTKTNERMIRKINMKYNFYFILVICYGCFAVGILKSELCESLKWVLEGMVIVMFGILYYGIEMIAQKDID